MINNHVNGQSDVLINDSLAAHADPMEVTMGRMFAKNQKFHFGNYVLVSAKVGHSRSRTKSNIWNSKSERNSTRKYYFELRDTLNGTAKVEIIKNTLTKTQNSYLLGVLNVGETQWVEWENYSASITTDDTSTVWVLSANKGGINNSGTTTEFLLTDGERRIFLYPIGLNQTDLTVLKLPLEGVEFIEKGKSLGALQYVSGPYREPRPSIWIDQRLDHRMKLILAAAMTVLLQMF